MLDRGICWALWLMIQALMPRDMSAFCHWIWGEKGGFPLWNSWSVCGVEVFLCGHQCLSVWVSGVARPVDCTDRCWVVCTISEMDAGWQGACGAVRVAHTLHYLLLTPVFCGQDNWNPNPNSNTVVTFCRRLLSQLFMNWHLSQEIHGPCIGFCSQFVVRCMKISLVFQVSGLLWLILTFHSIILTFHRLWSLLFQSGETQHYFALKSVCL